MAIKIRIWPKVSFMKRSNGRPVAFDPGAQQRAFIGVEQKGRDIRRRGFVADVATLLRLADGRLQITGPAPVEIAQSSRISSL